MKPGMLRSLALCAIAATSLLAAGVATAQSAAQSAAQSGAEFYNGKTVDYIVATDPGGGYDTNGRLVAEFMQKHLPGSTFVVRNMPGAGQIIGTNYLYASKPDGLTIGTFNTGLIYNQLAGNKAIRFDLNRMSWIGKLASDPRVILVSEQSGIENFADLMARQAPVKLATAGVGTASYIEGTMLTKVLGIPAEVINGYEGGAEFLAMRRGEVQAALGSRSSFEQFVREGHGHFIVQIGGTADDIPQLASLVQGEAALQAIALVDTQGSIARLTAGPEGIPEDRLAALRDAYAAAVSDPEFLERARTLGLPVDPLVGEAVGEAVAQALNQPPDVIAFLKEALE